MKRSGLDVVEDVTRLSAEDLAALPSMDQKVLDELVNALAALVLRGRDSATRRGSIGNGAEIVVRARAGAVAPPQHS